MRGAPSSEPIRARAGGRREGDLGYALVSDANETDLLALGAKVAGP